MRKICFSCTLILVVLLGKTSFAQDFSNKGKDFWVAYGYHQIMNGGGNAQEMVLYFAAEQTTNVTVSIPGIGYSQNYVVAANTVLTSNPIPKSGPQDVRLTTSSSVAENKGIHITSDKPIVAYAHIYNSSVSGATILFPTNTLGKDYFSVNYTNNSNSSNSNCWFYVVAADTGTTTVEITPSATCIGHAANVPFTISLTQGQVYNVMGTYGNATGVGTTGVDLTGSVIKSISTASGLCKRIAVFSGSGRINITCNGPSGTASSDNYMSQAFPKTAWGLKYLTVPAANGNSFNIYRVCVSTPGTTVRINGVPTGLPLQGNFYYEIAATNQPQLIEADKPIMVAQYFTSQNQCGNFTPNQLGDPEVIYLSPVEQNIRKVLWNATQNYQITQHFFNAIIPNNGISTFRLDGAPVPSTSFVPHPQAPGYSYISQAVGAGQHIIQSDSAGFNAIAYGYGNAESYGYNAGTNIKDVYQFLAVNNQYATVTSPLAACKGAPFSLSMTFPYQPTQLIWQFNGLAPDDTLNNPAYNATSIVNGKTLYRYDYPQFFTLNIGVYPIRILAQNPTADGCNGTQEINYDVEVFDLPVANFNFASDGCVSNPVSFTDVSATNGRPITHWYWNFGDGNVTNDVPATTHTYIAAGSYDVKHTVITDVGCKADTVIHTVILNSPPVANFTPMSPYCAGKTVRFKDNSTVVSGTIAKWYWNFGDGGTTIAMSNADQMHTYATIGPFTVTLRVETVSGCMSTVYSTQVIVSPNPVVNFNLPNVCLPTGNAQFNSTSTIADGTENQFTYLWNFGDASAAVGGQNPVHIYTSTGPFDVKLVVASNNGCIDSLTRSLTTVYAEPQAAFNAPVEICLGATINFADQSIAAGSTVSQWLWNFGDATGSNIQNPSKTYAVAGTYTVTLSITSAIGCQSMTPSHIATRTIIVNPLPVANFTTSLPGCVGQAVTFTDASVANAGSIIKWTWDYGDASNAILASGAPFTHSYSAVNTYNPSLQVETDKGCISTIVPGSVVINQLPIAEFVAPEICVNDVLAPFTDASTIGIGTVTSWSWNFGDPNASGGNPNVSTLQNPTHHYTQPGTYTAQLISTSGAGCKDAITHTVTVNGGILTPRFTIQNTTALCSNKAISIKDASTVDAGRILKIEIFWDAADAANTTTDASPTPGRTYTHTYPEFGTPLTKTYTVRYVVYSGLTCTNTYTQDITLLATPQLSFGAVLPVCSNAPSFQLSQAVVQNPMPGSGTFSGAGVSPTGIFNPQTAGAGQHPVTYTYNATNGCSNSIDQTVIVDPTPIADAGPDKVVLEGGSVVLTPKQITNIPVSYAWTPPTWLKNPAVANAEASPPTDFTYTLTVTSDKGCTTNDDVFVKLLKNLVVPNVFTPNGDGRNDRWEIKYLESYPGSVIEVFNRYGQLVYRSVGYTTPWDGTYKGGPIPAGTYYYIIDPKNGRKQIAGFVDILR